MNEYLSTRVSVRGLSVLPHVRTHVCQGLPTHRYKVWAGGSGPLVGGAGLSLCIDSWGAADSWGFWNLLNIQSELVEHGSVCPELRCKKGSGTWAVGRPGSTCFFR